MNIDDLAHLADVFSALSDKTRLRLLELMIGGEVSVGYLADSLGESQPKVSRHLAFLRNAGIVTTRRDGKWVYYAVDDSTDSRLDSLLQAAFGKVKTVSEATRPKAIVTPSQIERQIPEEPVVETDSYEEEREEIEVFLL